MRRCNFGVILALVGAAWFWASGPKPAPAAPLGIQNLVVYRVGDGSAPLTSAAAPVFIDVYSMAGALLQSIPLPSSGPQALTAVGNDPTEGIVSRSENLRSFTFTGYRKDAGSANPAADASATTNRVVGFIRLSGEVDTTTALVDAPDGVAVRSAATLLAGAPYWVGTAGGLRYIASPGGAATSVEIDGRDTRQVNIFSDDDIVDSLVASNSASSTTGKIINYGALPTSSTAGSPIVTLTGEDVVHGFVLFNRSASIPGDDVLFALSTGEGLLRKYVFDGTTWMARGSLPTTATNIGGRDFGSTAQLFLTTPTEIQFLTTSTSPLVDISGTITTLATAAANTAFRGINMTRTGEIPEPSSLAVSIGAVALLAFRIGRHRTTR